ncbi:hypothetical protein LX32DRAFT_677076 [Colletotrichum zoysiae]|uniref:Uncharacterized protein n=1 Tax=Colletotrichum zoysiae TaxID=1216348 RepID=A0AAD9H5A1_9PEZI|nr:hypothetical protein LX32DRAFT_677076 [Colletotrichum zoysiae]
MSTHSALATDQQPEAPPFRLVTRRSEERQSDELGRKATLSSRLKAVFPSRRAEKASKGEKTLEERRLVQLERRTLKESGDYLGVTGINPTTGELDVLTPSTTSFSSASLAIDQKLDSHKKTNTKKTNTRRGAAVLTEEVTQKLQQLEEQRFSRKDQEKEAIREAQRNVRWERHRQQWSSAKEPILSPIAQSIKSISTRESETKDQGRDLSKMQEVQRFHQTEMGHTDPMSHLPKYLISEDDGADSSNTVIRTPQRRRSSFVNPEIDVMGHAPAGVAKPTQAIVAASSQVQITPSSPISEQTARGGSALGKAKQATQSCQEFKILASTEVMEVQPLRVTCQFMGERQSEPSKQRTVEACNPRAIVTTSPSESSLIFQSRSVALDTRVEGWMARHPFSKLMNDHFKEMDEPSDPVKEPFMNQWMSPGAEESQENLPFFGAQCEMKDPTARPATTPITITIGYGQGRFLPSPLQSQPEKKCSESWSLLQNRHISRRYDDQMSTSTEDISTESVHQLANIKRRTENLAPKGSLTTATRFQEAAIQMEARKSFVKNLPGKELAEDGTDDFVTSHTSTSTSPLNARDAMTRWSQSEVVSLGAARAAVANSGSKMAQTRKRHLPEREGFRALPLSVRKPHADYVPLRRLRSSFSLLRRLDKGQQKPMEVSERKSGQGPELSSVRIGGSANRQTTCTTSKGLSSTKVARSKAGYSTSNGPANKDSEGGGIEGRLKREKLKKHVLKVAGDGKQMAGMLARWYWTVISPCFDPTSPARKRLDGNKSTWRDCGLFLFALGSGFMLLAAAVRMAQGMALVMQMVHMIVAGLIAVLGS